MYTQKSLEEKTMKELENICKLDKKKYYGFSKYTKKSDLANFILNQDNSANQDISVNQDNSTIQDDSASKFDETINQFASEFYKKIEQYTVKLQVINKLFDNDLILYVTEYQSQLKNHVISISKNDSFSGNTLKNYHSQIMILIENKVIDNNCKFSNNMLVDSFNSFSMGVNTAFKNEFKSAIKTTGVHLNERQNKTIKIDGVNLLKFAELTLSELSNKPTAWKQIAISLMIVTGRRLTEIMFSAEFEIVDDYHVNFTGQLKGIDYDTKGYIIPTLVRSNLVVNGINWLKLFGKRYNADFLNMVKLGNIDGVKFANKKTHGQFARYLNEEIKRILTDNVQLKDDDSWIIKYDDGKEKDRKTTHFCRQFYAQIAFNIFYERKNVRRKKHQILADILGHDYSSDKTRTASNNYDADFDIADFDDIAKMINY